MYDLPRVTGDCQSAAAAAAAAVAENYYYPIVTQRAAAAAVGFFDVSGHTETWRMMYIIRAQLIFRLARFTYYNNFSLFLSPVSPSPAHRALIKYYYAHFLPYLSVLLSGIARKGGRVGPDPPRKI